MPLTDEQIRWIETAQAKSADFAAFGEQSRVRNEEMKKLTAEIDRLRDQLKEANKALKVTWDDEGGKALFKKKKRDMDWMDGDRDSEVDTVHDLKGQYGVDPDAAKEVFRLHEQLVALQTRMEEAEYENPETKKKEKVFSAKDIERELWSPLVMEGVIPSNAVADKYSQEAQVWNGSCEIYNGILEDHTKNSSKHEGLQRALRIGVDVATLAGTVAAESIKAANFDTLLKDPKDPKVARDLMAANLAVVVVQGGLSIADKSLDKPGPNKSWKIAEAAFDAVGAAAVASMGLAEKQVGVSNPTQAKTAEFKTAMASANSLIAYGLKAGKVVFRFHEIVEATDEAGRKAAAAGLIKAVAGAVGDAFAAFDRKDGKDKDGNDVAGTDGAWGKVGGAVTTAIIGASNVGFIAEHIYKAKQHGGLKNPGALVGAIGLTVIGPIMSGVFDQLSDVSRKDVGKDDVSEGVKRSFEETPDDIGSNRASKDTLDKTSGLMGQSMDLLLGSSQHGEEQAEIDKAVDRKLLQEQIDKALKGLPDLKKLGPELMKSVPQGADEDSAKRAIAERLAKMALEEKQQAVGDFKKRLQQDPTFKAEFFKGIKEQSDEEAGKLDELIGEASGSPEDMADEEKARKAMASVDKLIREAAACNQRWQLVETLTGGGVAILVAALPVAGLAAAIQKLAMDTAILVRKSIQLNKWIDNMALTVGNNSVYGPAISSRLSSARVQVSQQAVRVVFDAVGVAAESAKLADCMGVATGISIANTLARALTEFGFKMHKEAECEAGWQLYKDARANPGDRKKARKAMRWNSTLSKCVMAYGIVIDGDPIAKEVGRSCGLTPEILQDQKDVCPKIVTYFATLYSDDPVVLRRIPLKKDWHPGTPLLTLDSWLRFKAAACERAEPWMSEASARTPQIDRFITLVGPLIGPDGNYARRRDALFPEIDPTDLMKPSKRETPEFRQYLTRTQTAVQGLIGALRAWKPVAGAPDDSVKVRWVEGMSHSGMVDVADSLIAQAQMIEGEVAYDLKVLDEAIRQKEALKKAQLEQAQKQQDGTEKDKEKDKQDA